MKKNRLAFLIILISTPAIAQTSVDSNPILVPIHRLFDGMTRGDSAMVHGAFADGATLVTVGKDKLGKSGLSPETLDQFLKAVGTPHAESWNEPIWEVAIQQDGVFAQVWAKYAFFLGRKFYHCGVDAFHLVQGDDGQWRIFHLADTRQKENCDVPKAVGDRFK